MAGHGAVRGGSPSRTFYAMSGLDQVRAIIRGEAPRPPISHLTGWQVTQATAGSVTLSMPASPWLRLPDGTLDVPIFLEASLQAAATTGAPPGVVMRTAAFSLSHFRPVATVGRLIARAHIVNSGRTFVFAEATMEDDVGRTVSHGSASLVAHPIDPPPSGRYEPVELPKYSTPDPHELPQAGEEMRYQMWVDLTGPEAIALMAADKVSVVPIYNLTDMRLTEGGEGYCAAELVPSAWIADSEGHVAEGVIASLVSTHMAGAVLSMSPGGRWIGIISQSLSFLRSVPSDAARVLVRATVVGTSAGFIVTTAEVTDDVGNQVAIGTLTAVLREQRQEMPRAKSTRALTTVLFTDIVDSTVSAERMGDERWNEVCAEHNDIVRRELRNFRGREIKTTGDGFLAVFDSPARGVHCARAIRDGVRRLEIEIRAGLHTGEIDLIGDDVAGIAVAITKRIEGAAGPMEVLVSSTVRDLVVGSGIHFADHGTHTLKGVEGDWHLYTVER